MGHPRRVVASLALLSSLMSVSCTRGGHLGGGETLVGRDMSPVDGGVDGGGRRCATVPDPPVTIWGPIDADLALGCDHVYLLSGMVVVDAPATLTIEKGTTLTMAGDASLIITAGARLYAVGTRDEPIVFTSAYLPGTRAPGNWGVVALYGRASGNWGIDKNRNVCSSNNDCIATEVCTPNPAGGKSCVITAQQPDANDWPTPDGKLPYIAGGNDEFDSSGDLQYVRIEYGGRPRIGSNATDHETLGLYGVGKRTLLDHIDVRQGNFECVFAEGGSFDARHFVCQASGNGGFGFTRGNHSRVQFLFDLESPKKAAEGIGLKGPFDANVLAPRTNPTLYNVTVCGTNGSPATVKDPFALFMNRLPAGRVYNFVGVGFHAGLAMINGAPMAATTELRSAILFDNFDLNISASTNIAYTTGEDPIYKNGNDTDLVSWFLNPDWKNSQIDPMLGAPPLGCFDQDHLQATPASPLTNGAATPPDDGFFDPSASYIGAFRDASDDWATGNWVVWSSN
jgi:hypothetical protein